MGERWREHGRGQRTTCGVAGNKLILRGTEAHFEEESAKVRHPRTGFRIPVELPVEVRWKSRSGKSRQVQGITENISGNGLFLKVPVRPHQKTTITMTVIIPAKVAQVPLELLCQGRVVRWSRPGELPGMGAIIDDYEFRPTHRQV